MGLTFSTTQKKCWIVNIKEPTERLEIQFDVRSIKVNRSIQMNDIAIIGRNNPFHHFTGGSTEYSFSLDLYADTEDLTDVMKRVKLIESWTYNEDFTNGVPSLKLIYGNLFANDDSTFVLSSFSYDLSHFDSEKEFMPKRANIEITLSLETNKKSSQIKRIY